MNSLGNLEKLAHKFKNTNCYKSLTSQILSASQCAECYRLPPDPNFETQLGLCTPGPNARIKKLNSEIWRMSKKSCIYMPDTATQWYEKQRNLQLNEKKSARHNSPRRQTKSDCTIRYSSPPLKCMHGYVPPIRSITQHSLVRPKHYKRISPEFLNLLKSYDAKMMAKNPLYGLPSKYIRIKRIKKPFVIGPCPPPRCQTEAVSCCTSTCSRFFAPKVHSSVEESTVCCCFPKKSKSGSKKGSSSSKLPCPSEPSSSDSSKEAPEKSKSNLSKIESKPMNGSNINSNGSKIKSSDLSNKCTPSTLSSKSYTRKVPKEISSTGIVRTSYSNRADPTATKSSVSLLDVSNKSKSRTPSVHYSKSKVEEQTCCTKCAQDSEESNRDISKKKHVSSKTKSRTPSVHYSKSNVKEQTCCTKCAQDSEESNRDISRKKHGFFRKLCPCLVTDSCPTVNNNWQPRIIRKSPNRLECTKEVKMKSYPRFEPRTIHLGDKIGKERKDLLYHKRKKSVRYPRLEPRMRSHACRETSSWSTCGSKSSRKYISEKSKTCQKEEPEWFPRLEARIIRTQSRSHLYNAHISSKNLNRTAKTLSYPRLEPRTNFLRLGKKYKSEHNTRSTSASSKSKSNARESSDSSERIAPKGQNVVWCKWLGNSKESKPIITESTEPILYEGKPVFKYYKVDEKNNENHTQLEPKSSKNVSKPKRVQISDAYGEHKRNVNISRKQTRKKKFPVSSTGTSDDSKKSIKSYRSATNESSARSTHCHIQRLSKGHCRVLRNVPKRHCKCYQDVLAEAEAIPLFKKRPPYKNIPRNRPPLHMPRPDYSIERNLPGRHCSCLSDSSVQQKVSKRSRSRSRADRERLYSTYQDFSIDRKLPKGHEHCLNDASDWVGIGENYPVRYHLESSASKFRMNEVCSGKAKSASILRKANRSGCTNTLNRETSTDSRCRSSSPQNCKRDIRRTKSISYREHSLRRDARDPCANSCEHTLRNKAKAYYSRGREYESGSQGTDDTSIGSQYKRSSHESRSNQRYYCSETDTESSIRKGMSPQMRRRAASTTNDTDSCYSCVSRAPTSYRTNQCKFIQRKPEYILGQYPCERPRRR